MKKIILILTLAAITGLLSAQTSKESGGSSILSKPADLLNQSKMTRADKLFDALAYAQACPLYEELATSNFSMNHVSRRLADCYRNLLNPAKAEHWYAKVVEQPNQPAETYLYYAEALRSNGKYEESNTWMKKYMESNSGDTRAQRYTETADFFKLIKSQPERFLLKHEPNLSSTNSDFGAVKYGDKVIFASSRAEGFAVKSSYAWDGKPFLDLFSCDTANLSGGTIQSYGGSVNTQYHEGPVCFSRDGKKMYFTRNNYNKGKRTNSQKGVNHLEIYKADRVGEAWGNIVSLPFNNSEYSVGHPALTNDEKRLFFVSNMPGGVGGTDIYYVDIKEDGSFGTPVNVGKQINTEGNEMFPFVHKNGWLFFSSDGWVGLGGLDVFYAEPSGDFFQNPKNLGLPINSSRDDFAFNLDDEMKKGFLSSNRDGGKGDDDIYSFEMTMPFILELKAKITSVEKGSTNILKGVTIIIKDGTGKVVQTATTDDDGTYKMKVEPETDYTITAELTGYESGNQTFTTKNLGTKTEVESVVELEKSIGFILVGLISDKKTNAPIEGVKVSITDKASGKEVYTVLTGLKGDLRKVLEGAKLNDQISYDIKLEKEGYMTKSAVYTKVLTRPGEYNLNEVLDVNLEPVAVGMDLAKMIDIKPIYFDLSKWNIRPDAAAELDKIVKVMQENPTMVIELGSHTDCRSSEKFNMDLSDKRAKASAAYIIAKGIPKERIYGKGYGESKLVNDCACEGAKKSDCDEVRHQQNRRTEFIIVKM